MIRQVAAYQYIVSKGAQDDIEKCLVRDPDAAARIIVFLDEIDGCPSYAQCMIDEQYDDDNVQNVVAFYALQNKRINGYRVKLVEVSDWRLIFIVDHKRHRVGLFAVMQRSQNYDADPALMKRLEGEFNAYGFTTY